MNQPDTQFINAGKPDVATPYDWLGFPGFGEAVMRLQAESYIRSCHAVASLSWWKRRQWKLGNPQLLPGYYGARDMIFFHRGDYLVHEIQWAHSLAFPKTPMITHFPQDEKLLGSFK